MKQPPKKNGLISSICFPANAIFAKHRISDMQSFSQAVFTTYFQDFFSGSK
jgi:hypothetical protein